MVTNLDGKGCTFKEIIKKGIFRIDSIIMSFPFSFAEFLFDVSYYLVHKPHGLQIRNVQAPVQVF